MNCLNCNSIHVKKKGVRVRDSGVVMQRYQCNSCNTFFSKAIVEETERDVSRDTKQTRRYAITSCQNNADVNVAFTRALRHYCDAKDVDLLVVPILYRPDDHEVVTYNIPEDISHTLVSSKLKIHDEVFVMGKFNFLPTTVNPLAGLESLSKGDTLIVPSPQLRMKSSAVSASRHPAILHTTGAISHPQYTNTKVGEKAAFNHVYAAVLVEVDSENDYHIRVLKCNDDNQLIDLGEVWDENGFVEHWNPVALVTGDEHAMFTDSIVENTTYHDTNGIVKTLKPMFVVRHDVLDMYSGSHHHKGNNIKTVGKHLFGIDSVERELDITVDYLKRTSGDFINIIVPANHNDHLTKWLGSVNIKEEPWNAKLYHKLMYHVLDTLEPSETGISHADPFELYCNWKTVPNTRFLKPTESFKIHDVELGQHGHVGKNGARGSINQFADMSDKYVIGHSHTPGIVGGCYQVGTSSKLKLEYTNGASSWLHTHCLVYNDGTRQLINIINGKWRA